MSELDVTLPDGRTLHVHDDGDPQGFPVVFHHGTPACGRLHPHDIEDARAKGIRLIGFDRAGYGRSDANFGRSVGDVAADVADMLDALAADRFATWGHSGGGPHALACAALLPGRCVAAATLASVAPYGAEGLDFLDGMGELNVQEIQMSLERTPEEQEAAIRESQAELFSAGPDGLLHAMRTILSPLDQGVMTDEFAAWGFRVMSEGAATRIEGWRDDDRAMLEPWGFDLADIRVPVLLLQGTEDLMVPPAHGRWLAEAIPGVEAEISTSEGHLTLLANRVPDVHEWLLARGGR
ncbi:MAG TPA: alpha/beta hydrolase [Gaiellaceae bacterium]|nr:alpha/beta hydrolase [Gaiellaceae bacterium]